MSRVRALVGAASVVAGLACVVAASLGSPASGPDPFVQAVPDGCRHPTDLELLSLASPEWVYVDDRNYPASGPPPPPRWGHGVIQSGAADFYASHPAVNDLPTNHLSYDFVFNLLPDPNSAFLLAGDPARRTGNYGGASDKTGRLHIEWEEEAFPPFAWPSRGDRVSVLGSWVWDCGHWDEPGGETTELHPFRAIWVQRNPGGVSPQSPYGEAEGDLFISTHKTPAASEADCAHRVKGNPEGLRACILGDSNWQDVSGSYRFVLPAPSRPRGGRRLVVRVRDRGSTANAPRVRVTTTRRGAAVAIDVSVRPEQRLVLAKQVFVGWAPVRPSSLPVHLRLRFEELLVHRAMDPGCPLDNPSCPANVQSTRLGTISASPGEWNLYWSVAGIWGRWLPHIRPRDGQRFRTRQTVDFYVRRRAAWQLLFLGRECDLMTFGRARDPRGAITPCPAVLDEYGLNDGPGIVVDSYRGAAGAGRHRSSGRAYSESTCPAVNPRGCFTLTYRVSVVDDARTRAAARRR